MKLMLALSLNCPLHECFFHICDVGVIQLKSSLTYRDKFERGHRDEFVIEAVDIGELKKIR